MAALSKKQRDELLTGLKVRFERNISRHSNMEWAQVQARLESSSEKLWSLHEMERTGGEPDVVGMDPKTGEFIFYDCSAESPKGRRSLCYDRAALDSRKENKPNGSAVDMASSIGIEILTEEQYRGLQKLGNFDLKTSSWVKTPAMIRKLGGALFAIAALTRFSCITTARNLTTRQGASVPRCGCSDLSAIGFQAQEPVSVGF